MQKLLLLLSEDFMECDRINPNVERSASIFRSSAWRLEIGGHDRWEIYHRLQSLAIDCDCGAGQPLTVQIDSPQDLIQCWSVMRYAMGMVGDRLTQAATLEACWRLDVKS